MDQFEAALAIYNEMIRVNALVRRGVKLSDIVDSDKTLLERAKKYMERGSKSPFPHFVLRYYQRLAKRPIEPPKEQLIPFKTFTVGTSIVCSQDDKNVIFLRFPWRVDKHTQTVLRGYPFFMKLTPQTNQWWRKNTGDIDDKWCELLADVARKARRITHVQE